MTANGRTYLLVAVVLALLVGIPIGVRQYRIAKTAAFCRAVGDLPPAELVAFADRCDHLMWKRGGPAAELEFIRDAKTLAQFALLEKIPYEIVVEKGHVGLKYHDGHWSYSDLLSWGEDYDSNGDRIRVLKIAYGSYGFRVLCQRAGGHSEPGAPPNGGPAEPRRPSGATGGPPSVS